VPSFVPSVPPDITESIPAAISARTAALAYASRDIAWDCAIADLPFLMAPSDSNPYVRQTAEARKDQFDTSPEPGEQSLSQWWVRSQDSWHRGAGIKFYEPGTVESTRNRFRRSVGVDVWTEGEISLLHRMDKPRAVSAAQDAYATSAVVDNVDVAFLEQAGVVYRWDGTTAVTYSASGGTPATPVAVAGAKILVGTTQSILSGDSDGNSLSALWTASAGATITPHWVKSRVIATRGHQLFELTLAGGSLPTPLFSHPDTGWTWTGVAETPTAILVSGHGSGYGAVYRLSLVTDTGTAGSTPTLGSVEQIAEFPPGEIVTAIRVYLGNRIAIGTNEGVRIGEVSEGGSLVYGPLVVPTEHPVTSLAARDRFVFAGVEADIDGSSGLARIDLSQEIGEGSLRFAWAWDVMTHDDGPVSSVGFLGDRVLVGVNGEGFYLQSVVEYEDSGYFETGRIRYGTTIPKNFNFTQVRAKLEVDTGLSVFVTDLDVETFVFRLTDLFNTDQDINLPDSDSPRADLELKIVLEASEDLESTPTLESLAVKALPRPEVQRLIQFPLTCFDRETDRNGVRVGVNGGAWMRLQALEALESERSLVQIREFGTGESYQGWVQRVEFQRTQPSVRSEDNFGGRLTVTVLRL
jgi:hypothetical protein